MRKFLMLVLTISIVVISFKMLSNHDYFPNSPLLKLTGQSVDLDGKAAILLDKDSGEIVFSKNANMKLYPASTTKILTALLAIERGDPEARVTAGKEVWMNEAGESSAGIKQGDVLSLRELIAGLLLPSGNDAARVIAVYVAKKDLNSDDLPEQAYLDYFAELMNNRADELGATHSNFVNPNGLHNHNHYSTAHDIALIANEAMNHPEIANLAGQKTFSDQSVSYNNRNKLVDPNSDYYYEGATGIKTGFTDEAGYCLVSSATKKEKEFIAVVLHSTETGIWKDSTALLDFGFEKIVSIQ